MTAQLLADGRYLADQVLGRGGMATVFLAHDRELDRRVAIKLLPEPLGHDEQFARRFRREAQTAAGLAHPNIVQVFDAGEDEGRLFIVMEYVEGDGLDEILARDGRLEPGRVLALAEQACSALQYAHEHGVVHRDVKPANLLLRRDGLLKIADFGIARAAQATQLTQTGTILGTLNYVAPEHARGEQATPQADIYSLGVVLYELLTGEPPRRFEHLAQLAVSEERPVPPMRDLVPDVSPEVEAAVMRSLARDPRYRQRSASELAGELRGEGGKTAATVPLAGEATPAEPATVPLRRAPRRPTPRRAGIGKSGVAAAAAILAAVLALIAFAATRGDGDSERAPARVEPVPAGEDALEQAQNLAAWLREHTRAGGEP